MSAGAEIASAALIALLAAPAALSYAGSAPEITTVGAGGAAKKTLRRT